MIFKKGNTMLILLLVLGLLLFAFLWFEKGGNFQKTTMQEGGPEITNASDLNSAGRELDNTDLNQMDAELNQLDSDTSTF